MIVLFPPLLTVLVFVFTAASGHKDSVTCTGFSHDGKYVATADMGGLVQVWLTSSGEKVWSFETSDIEVNSDFILLEGTLAVIQRIVEDIIFLKIRSSIINNVIIILVD